MRHLKYFFLYHVQSKSLIVKICFCCCCYCCSVLNSCSIIFVSKGIFHIQNETSLHFTGPICNESSRFLNCFLNYHYCSLLLIGIPQGAPFFMWGNWGLEKDRGNLNQQMENISIKKEAREYDDHCLEQLCSLFLYSHLNSRKSCCHYL